MKKLTECNCNNVDCIRERTKIRGLILDVVEGAITLGFKYSKADGANFIEEFCGSVLSLYERSFEEISLSVKAKMKRDGLSDEEIDKAKIKVGMGSSPEEAEESLKESLEKDAEGAGVSKKEIDELIEDADDVVLDMDDKKTTLH